MVVQKFASVAREHQAVDDLLRRLEGGFRYPDMAAGLLEPIASFIGAQSASLRLVAASDPSAIPAPLALVNISRSVGDAYLGRYCDLDPARKLPRRRLAGPVFADQDRPGQWLNMPTPDMSSGHRAQFREYRRRFLEPFDLVHHAGFYLHDTEQQTLLFDFHRGRSARSFDRLETSRMRIVAHYLYARFAARWIPAPPAPALVAHAGTLTVRESEVATAVARGLSNKAIAVALQISVRTVENHMRSIFEKLGVGSRTQLAAACHRTIPATRQ